MFIPVDQFKAYDYTLTDDRGFTYFFFIMFPHPDPFMPLVDSIKLVLIPKSSLFQDLQSNPQTVLLSLQSMQSLQLLQTHR